MLNRKGFTLIELLIVVVILGILATVTITAINPVEQIRRTQDSGRQSDSGELLSALERFYASYKGQYPWDTSATCGAPANDGSSTVDACWTTILTNAGEIKPAFPNRASISDMFVTLDADNAVHICFAPQSQSFLDQAKYDVAGGTGTTHICVPE